MLKYFQMWKEMERKTDEKNRNYRSHGAWSRNFKIENECCKNNKKSKYGIFWRNIKRCRGCDRAQWYWKSKCRYLHTDPCRFIWRDTYHQYRYRRFSGRTDRYRGYRCFHRCPSAWHGCACIRLSVRRDPTAWNFKFSGGRENGIPCQECVRESQHRSESVLRQDRKRRPVYLW